MHGRAQTRVGILFKLLSGFGIIVAIGLVILVLANRTIEATAIVLKETVAAQHEILSTTNHLVFSINQLRVMESDLGQLEDFYAVTATLEQLQAAINMFDRDLSNFTGKLIAKDKENSSKIKNSWKAYRADLKRIIEAAESMNTDEVSQISTFSSSPRFQILSRQLEDISARVRQEGLTQFHKSITDLESMQHTFLWLAVAGALAVVVLSILLSRSLSLRIGKLSQAASLMAEGKRSEPVSIKGRDEIAELSSIFNMMQDKINSRETMLRTAQEHLEHRVNARTRELAERTRELEKQTQELTKAKNEAEIANKAKSTFLSSMSHELRTPLNAILGYAQLFQLDDRLTADQREGIDIIRQSGNHLLSLISDLLDISKIEARKLELTPSNIHLSNFLWDIATALRVSAEEKKLDFLCDFEEKLPTGIRVDGQRLRQVLYNLLSNAIKFTQEGRVTFRVQVRHEPDNGSCLLRFEIIDSGTGISEEHQQSIFTPFEQVGSLKDNAQGTGLGLAISQRLIEKMGSRIRVDSQPGHGARFWFDLNCPVVEVEPEIITQESTVTGFSGEPRTILIVDDNPGNIETLRSFLSAVGFQLLDAESGAEAIQLLNATKPDLILLDLHMPEMDGFEAARRIRLIPGCSHTPIIAMAGTPTDTQNTSWLEAGCDSLLEKPFSLVELTEHIGSVLKLKWKYSHDTVKENEQATTTLTLPDKDQLEELYTLAKYGNMKKVQSWAKDLARENPALSMFAEQLTVYAKNYQEQKIIELAKYYLDHCNE